MAWGNRSGGGRGIAWLALLVSLAALFLSWKAYERTGGRLKDLDAEVAVGEPAPADLTAHGPVACAVPAEQQPRPPGLFTA